MKMKNSIKVLVFLPMFAVLFSCNNEQEPQTVSGLVIDATMNNIMVLTNSGDTVNISTMDTDPAKVPGVLLSDSVQITYVKEKAGDVNILKAQELKITTHSPLFYIKGTWVEPNPINAKEVQGVILKDNGDAESVGMATLIFKSWVLSGNKLMLTSESLGNKQTLRGVDTLQIDKLDADSLILSSNGNVVWRFGHK